jgi:hypothetical protein
MAYTDSTTISQTLATTSETELTSINVPSGLVYTLTSLWAGHDNGGGGEIRLAIDTYTQGRFQYVMNGLSSSVSSSDIRTPVNIAVRGPALIQTFATPDDNTSGEFVLQVEYINSEGSTN